jgi:hypothetical protein
MKTKRNKTQPATAASRRLKRDCSTAPIDICDRARLLKPLADEASKVLLLARETNDHRFLNVAAETLNLVLEAM